MNGGWLMMKMSLLNLIRGVLKLVVWNFKDYLSMIMLFVVVGIGWWDMVELFWFGESESTHTKLGKWEVVYQWKAWGCFLLLLYEKVNHLVEGEWVSGWVNEDLLYIN